MCSATTTTPTSNPDSKRASASIVCGACMAVGAHIGRGGLCRASLAEAPDNVDIATLPRADPHGPRITALEQHNANSYNEADALEKIREEALSNANANPNRGGAAVQRALLEDRKAELTSATKTANAAKKAHSKAKTHLAQMEQGYDKNSEPQEHLDLDDEDVFLKRTRRTIRTKTICTLGENARRRPTVCKPRTWDYR